MSKLFFHIGFHKTGTTWLQNVCFEKKSVFNLLNNYKQPWNDELCINIIQKDEYDFDPTLCRSIIDKRSKRDKINIVSAERLSGLPITMGYDSEIIARRINNISNNAKIIIVTREAKEFIPSMYRQMIKSGYPGTLHDFLMGNPWTRTGSPKKYLFQEKIIDYYIELFGNDNVLVLDFKEFKNDKPRFLRKLQDFMGVNDLVVSEEDQNNKINQNRYSDKRLKALRLINRIRVSESNPYPLIRVSSSVARKLSFILSVLFSSNGLIDQKVIDDFLS